MRKKLLFLLVFGVIATFSLTTFIAGNTAYAASGRSSEIAMELETGTVLSESSADVRMPMASTTKIMTALIIAEECDLDTTVKVPDCAAGVEGSSVYLKKGEEIDVRDLLYGLMLRSGNDCATALAVIHSGSVDKFADRMNERARELGAFSTNFKNPSGLPDDDHYTTARDLCVISCAAMKNDTFRKVVGTRTWHGKYRSYSNKNKMLYNYDGATGIKTGYTVKAGRCLVSSALRDGMEVVCVVLNRYDMYEHSSALLDYCFSAYSLVGISPDKVFMCGKNPCHVAEEYKLVLRKGVEVDYRLTENAEGNANGKIEIYQGKSLIFSADLYSIV